MASSPDHATLLGTLAANCMLVLAADKGSSMKLIWETQRRNIVIAIQLAHFHKVGPQAGEVYRRLIASRRAELDADCDIKMVSIMDMTWFELDEDLNPQIRIDSGKSVRS